MRDHCSIGMFRQERNQKSTADQVENVEEVVIVPEFRTMELEPELEERCRVVDESDESADVDGTLQAQ